MYHFDWYERSKKQKETLRHVIARKVKRKEGKSKQGESFKRKIYVQSTYQICVNHFAFTLSNIHQSHVGSLAARAWLAFGLASDTTQPVFPDRSSRLYCKLCCSFISAFCKTSDRFTELLRHERRTYLWELDLSILTRSFRKEKSYWRTEVSWNECQYEGPIRKLTGTQYKTVLQCCSSYNNLIHITSN